MKKRWLFVVFLTACGGALEEAQSIDALVACGSQPSTPRAEVDCNVREPEFQDNTSCCLRASQFNGCIPASSFSSWGCLELDANAELCTGGGDFAMTVHLTTSNVNLDCNSQTIDHRSQGQHSGVRASNASSVQNVLVKDCTIQNVGRYGANLKRIFRGAELDGPMRGHENITLDRVNILNTGRIGVYVGQNSRNMSFNTVVISNAHSGFYLEAGSEGTRIFNSVVTMSRTRAGVMIDSSRYNTIENSYFSDNAGGSIELYRNCGETHGQVCTARADDPSRANPVRRKYGASFNTIRGNQFHGDVYVAKRQFKLYGPQRCAGISIAGYWEDTAEYNLIQNNQFYDAKLDIQDEANGALDNRFYASLLEIGTSTPLTDPPVIYTGEIARNRFDEDSWMGVVGNVSNALNNVVIYDNEWTDGRCFDEFERSLMCNDFFVQRRSRYGCYAAPQALPGSNLCTVSLPGRRPLPPNLDPLGLR